MRFKWLSWMLIFVLLLGACGAPNTDDTGKQPANAEGAAGSGEAADQAAEKGDSSQTNYPLTVKDDTGTEVTIEQEPQKIISVLPSDTEIAFALGLDKQIIAVTDNDDYPEQVNEKEKVGGMELNIEKIVSLEPDLVLAGLLNGEAVQKLRDLGITVLVSEGENLDDTYASIKLIGEVTNRTEQAEEIVRKMKTDVKQIEQLVADIPEGERVDVWLEVSPDLFTAGAGTMLDELVAIAGGNNVAAEELEGWGQLSEEKVVALDPDIIVGTYPEEQLKQAVEERQAWSEVEAVKNGNIYGIDGNLLNRPGPRLTEGLWKLTELFYPDVVTDKAS